MHINKQQMTSSSWGAGMRRRGQVLMILLGLLGCWQPCQAAEFTCTSTSGVGDVACLIAAINTANANGETNTVTLAAGTYTLTEVDNNDGSGSNGLPSITGTLTMIGAGAEATIIARPPGASFRLVHVAVSGRLALERLTLRGGSSSSRDGGGFGGGLLNSGGTVTLTQSTLAHNSAISSMGTTSGGGLVNNGGTVTLFQSTLADNADSERGGGGLFNFAGTVTLHNTIVTRNTGPTGPNCVGPVMSLGYNLLGAQTGCTITLQPTDVTGAPELGTFTDLGQPGTGHIPLLPGSPAINAGNDAACPLTDQLGQPRVGRCDIGAIEFQPSDTTPPVVTIVSVTPETLSPPNGRLVPVTIVATITDAGSGVDPSTTAYAVEDEYGSVEPSGGPLTLKKSGDYTVTIFLEASRHGNDLDGREYTITISAQDNEGNMGSADAIVTVPHDQGQGRISVARRHPHRIRAH